jgi:hypothetical protein
MADILKPKDLELINQQLADLEAIQKDLEKAQKASVTGADELVERCRDCASKCKKVKEVYFTESI